MTYYYPNPNEKAFYDKLWSRAPVENEVVQGVGAVEFLRKSSLELTVLKQIWALSTQVGTMNKDQFFVALRLIALYQHGVPLSQGMF